MASSATSNNSAAAKALGEFLTGTEAKEIADRLADGDTLTAALRAVSSGRRDQVRLHMAAAALGTENRRETVLVLRAVEGARSTTTSVDPLWTMPGHLVQSGALTSSVARLVDDARQSVTCSTFNFQRSSGLWAALHAAAERPEVYVRVYVDARAADQEPSSWSPSTSEIAEHIWPGVVLKTMKFDGTYVRNHAKFLAIDHRFLLVTSANFSWSAEHGNVEFGLLLDDRNLTESVEQEMHEAEDAVYERVVPEAR